MGHELKLQEREILTLTGVSEVSRFEDTAVVLRTALGRLLVQGKELKLRTLSLEGGRVEIRGEISALVYEERRESRGFLGRLLG